MGLGLISLVLPLGTGEILAIHGMATQQPAQCFVEQSHF